MKFLPLIILLVSISSFAKVVDSSINDDLDYKIEPDTQDQQRALASGEDEKLVDEQDEELVEEQSEKEQNLRDPANTKDEFKDGNQNIRFWKY